MWLRFLSCCSLALAAAASLAADMRESAWRAREMLGPDRWSQVLRIEESHPFSKPTVIHALVFELEDRLWYYADDRGTQSLSTHRDRLAQDKADLGPLLKKIDPRLVRFEVLPDEPPEFVNRRDRTELPQGCFIESVAYLRRLIETGRAPDDARLLAYYGIYGAGQGGHTILYYETQGHRFFYDPAGAAAPKPIPNWVRLDALAIAQTAESAFAQRQPDRAVFLPLHMTPAAHSERTNLGVVASNTATHEPASAALVN